MFLRNSMLRGSYSRTEDDSSPMKKYFWIRNSFGAPTGRAPLFDYRMTRKIHARDFRGTRREVKGNFRMDPGPRPSDR
jgi:hypothetical protein